MPDFDPAAAAALDETTSSPAWFLWADFLDDPLYVTSFGKTSTMSGTGDPELDGKTFTAFDGRLLDIGDVSNSDTGSDTLVIERSGLPSIDAGFLAEIADRSKWYGRTCRIWGLMYDETGVEPQGAIVPWYTGYMSRAPVIPGGDSQTVRVEIEDYLAIFNQPSNRSWLGQKDFDPDDNSAQATMAAANMGRGAASGSGGGGSAGSGGGTSRAGLIGAGAL